MEQGEQGEASRGAGTLARGGGIPVEVDLLILSFLGHFSWELLQAPLYSSFEGTSHVAGILMCLRATLGDLVIAFGAFRTSALIGGGRCWVDCPTGRTIVVFIAFGLLATVALEHLSTEVLDRWTYGPGMPRLPLLGTGLSPFVQWIVVPSLVLWYLGRLSRKTDRTSSAAFPR